MRYIWGGDEGREARGSAKSGLGASGEVSMGVVGGRLKWLPGGGAPFTSWSRLDIAINVQAADGGLMKSS